ncbi:MAG: bpX6 domain-containing protein [Myxococcaceae bacterium]|nr:bpX6 domain-containing protein [Myxococcaceae bacterium]
MSLSAHRLVLEGRQRVAAVLVPDTPEARARVLRNFVPGDAVLRLVERPYEQANARAVFLVRFAEPKDLDVDQLSGTPFILHGVVLCSVPLATPGLSALSVPPGHLVMAQGGQLVTSRLAPQEEDLSTWLDVSAVRLAEVPPRPPVVVSLAPPPSAQVTLRPKVEGLGPEASRALVDALKDVPGIPRPPWWKRAGAAALRWLRARRPPERTLPSGAPAPASPLQRAERWVNQQLDRTPVGRWLDDFNRRYVDRLLRAFETEQLDDALKHAVPLSRKPASNDAPTPHLPFAARDSLALDFHARGRTAGASPALPHDVYEALKARYREAAKKLEGAGRIDEAAFVLADLLDAPQEAVDLLERHGQLEKAAKLAEARALQPDAVIRLWILAGNPARGIMLARKHRAFASAVARLEQGHLSHAKSLRLVWAESLAAVGDYAGAVKVASPVPDARALTVRWCDLGLEAGGPGVAPLLVKRLELVPDEPQRPVSLGLELLGDDREDGAPLRSALADALTEPRLAVKDDARLPLQRAAIRALVRDEAATGVRVPGALAKLLTLDDGLLRADAPTSAPGVRPVNDTTYTRFDRDGTALTPLDAVLLPNGAVLVALGENGVALVGRDGKTAWRADAPAHRLVLGAEGQVLAVAPREDVVVVTRVELAPRRATRWAELPLRAWAPTMREGLWFVDDGANVVGLDVSTDAPRPLWQLPRPVGPVFALAADGARVSVLVDGPGGAVRRTWTQPSMAVAFDAVCFPVPAATGTELHQGAVTPDGEFLLVGRGPGGETRSWAPGASVVAPLATAPIPGKLTGRIGRLGALQAVPTQWRSEAPDQLDVLIRPIQRVLQFSHATRADTRLDGAVLTVVSDNGRVVCLDVTTQRVVRNLTVRP